MRVLSNPHKEMENKDNGIKKMNEFLARQGEQKVEKGNDSLDEFDELVKFVQEENSVKLNTHESFKEDYELEMKIGKSFLCSIRVLEDNKLSPFARIVFFTISSLSYNKGYCYATNKFLREKFDVSTSTVQRALKELCEAGLIGYDPSIKPGDIRHIHIQFIELRVRYYTCNSI